MTYRIPIMQCRLVRDGRRTVEAPEKNLMHFVRASEFFRAVMRPESLPHEEVWIALLNGCGDVTSALRVSQGGLHGCSLTPRDVLRPVIAGGASAFIMAHNHPSGDPTPSRDDYDMTKALAAASKLVGVDMLDHIVIASGGSRSLRELGAL